jgi:hypothetical protein
MLDDATLAGLNGLTAEQVTAVSELIRDDAVRKLFATLSATRILELQTGLTTARLEALAAELPAATLDQLFTDFGPTRLAALTDTLTARGVHSIAAAAGNDGLELIERITVLQASGKLQGLDDWVAFSITGSNKTGADLANTLAELTEAERLAKSSPAGDVVVIGQDTQTGGRSIDLAVTTAGGTPTREVEVTTIQGKVTRASQFTDGVTHALDKVGSSPTGTVEATIQCEFAASEPLGSGANTRVITADGRWEILDPTGTVRARGDFLAELATTLTNDKRFAPITRVNITTPAGVLIATIEQQAGTFVVIR